MKIIQGIIEKLIYSSILAPLIKKLIDIIIIYIGGLPQISIQIGSKVINNKYTIYIIIIMFCYFVLATILSSRLVWNRKLSKICPDFRFFSTLKVFSSNGYATYEYEKDNKIDYIKVTLHNFPISQDDNDGFTTSSDCGIIFLKELECWPFLKGYKISDKKVMSFWIIGRDGGEAIGLSFKNLQGHEQKIPLNLLMEGNIEKDSWKKVSIDLKKFRKVTHGIRDKIYIECFTFFTNSKLAKDKETVFFLRDINFK